MRTCTWVGLAAALVAVADRSTPAQPTTDLRTAAFGKLLVRPEFKSALDVGLNNNDKVGLVLNDLLDREDEILKFNAAWAREYRERQAHFRGQPAPAGAVGFKAQQIALFGKLADTVARADRAVKQVAKGGQWEAWLILTRAFASLATNVPDYERLNGIEQDEAKKLKELRGAVHRGMQERQKEWGRYLEAAEAKAGAGTPFHDAHEKLDVSLATLTLLDSEAADEWAKHLRTGAFATDWNEFFSRQRSGKERSREATLNRTKERPAPPGASGRQSPSFSVHNPDRLIAWPFVLAEELKLGKLELGYDALGFDSADALSRASPWIVPRIRLRGTFGPPGGADLITAVNVRLRGASMRAAQLGALPDKCRVLTRPPKLETNQAVLFAHRVNEAVFFTVTREDLPVVAAVVEQAAPNEWRFAVLGGWMTANGEQPFQTKEESLAAFESLRKLPNKVESVKATQGWQFRIRSGDDKFSLVGAPVFASDEECREAAGELTAKLLPKAKVLVLTRADQTRVDAALHQTAADWVIELTAGLQDNAAVDLGIGERFWRTYLSWKWQFVVDSSPPEVLFALVPHAAAAYVANRDNEVTGLAGDHTAVRSLILRAAQTDAKSALEAGLKRAVDRAAFAGCRRGYAAATDLVRKEQGDLKAVVPAEDLLFARAQARFDEWTRYVAGMLPAPSWPIYRHPWPSRFAPEVVADPRLLRVATRPLRRELDRLLFLKLAPAEEDEPLRAMLTALGDVYSDPDGRLLEPDFEAADHLRMLYAEVNRLLLVSRFDEIGPCIHKVLTDNDEWLARVAPRDGVALFFRGALAAGFARNVARPSADPADFHDLWRAARRGVPHARYLLGQCYEHGYGMVRDPAAAAAEYAAAAERNHPLALSRLAVCYATGDGVKKDERRADALRKRLCLLGFADLACGLDEGAVPDK